MIPPLPTFTIKQQTAALVAHAATLNPQTVSDEERLAFLKIVELVNEALKKQTNAKLSMKRAVFERNYDTPIATPTECDHNVLSSIPKTEHDDTDSFKVALANIMYRFEINPKIPNNSYLGYSQSSRTPGREQFHVARIEHFETKTAQKHSSSRKVNHSGCVNATDVFVEGAPSVMQHHSPLEEIPNEIVIQILKHVNHQDIGACLIVNKIWNQIFNVDSAWRELLYSHFPGYSPPVNSKNCKETYRLFYTNLANGVYSKQLTQIHPRKVCSLAISNDELFCGYADGTIKIWDLNAKKCTGTLEKHLNWVSSITFSEKQISSTDCDGTIKIWDRETKNCIATIQSQKKTAIPHVVFKELVYFVYENHQIGIWDLNAKKIIALLKGHSDTIQSLVISNGELYSGSADGSIKIWNLINKECDTTLEDVSAIYSLAIFSETICSGTVDGIIKLWDRSTKTCRAAFNAHARIVSSLALSEGLLYSASLYDNAIKIWNLNTKKCVHIIKGGIYNSHSFVISKGVLFSGVNTHIQTLDFTAEHNKIFEELESLLEIDDGAYEIEALERFSKMPNVAKNRIYMELHKILKLDSNSHNLAQSKCAFHNKGVLSCTPSQKAQAIRNYLQEKQLKNKTDQLSEGTRNRIKNGASF